MKACVETIKNLVCIHGSTAEKVAWNEVCSLLDEETASSTSNNTAMLEIAVLLREVFGIVESGGDHNLSGREIENRLDAVVLQLQQ